MTADHIIYGLLVIIIVSITVLSILFFMLVIAGKTLTVKAERTNLGTALGHTIGSLGVFLLALTPFFINRMLSGPGQPIPNVWWDAGLRLVLAVSIIWSLVGALVAMPNVVRRLRDDPREISMSGVFGTLAQAMPIIIADSKGIIQHTTPALDELANAAPGELIGRNLKEIMPQRYRARHDAGMAHYVATREKRIVGTVVMVEMLRMDGTEVPVYLALNTTDVDGVPWFIAALWQKEPETPDTIIDRHLHQHTARQNERDAQQDDRQHRQDTREIGQDERALDQDIRGWGMSRESMKQEAQQRDMDTHEAELNERDKEK